MNPQFEKTDNQTRIGHKEIINNKMCSMALKSLELKEKSFHIFPPIVAELYFNFYDWNIEDDS